MSCAYLAGRAERVEPWFAEQLGIQHHFYGFPGPEPFLAHVGALVAAHGAEFEAVVDEAYAATASAADRPALLRAALRGTCRYSPARICARMIFEIVATG